MANISASATTVFWPPDNCFIDCVSPCPVNDTYSKNIKFNLSTKLEISSKYADLKTMV